MQQAQAARALSELSDSDPGCEAIAAAGGLHALVHAMRSSRSVAVRQHAATALARLAVTGAEDRSAIAATGIVPFLVQMLYEQEAAGEAAAFALYALTAGSSDREGRQQCAAIVAAGGVPALAAALRHGTNYAPGYAAAALSNVGRQGGAFAAQIVAAGAGPSLVALLTSGDDLKQGEAAAALANLALAPQHRAAIAEAGAVPLLVAQLSHSLTEVQTRAACALHNLSDGEQSTLQAVLEQPGVIHGLMRLLIVGSSSSSGGYSRSNTGSFSTQAVAAGALNNLAEGGLEACQAITTVGLEPLLQLLLTGDDPNAVQLGLQVLELISAHPQCRAEVVAAGAVPALQHLQQSGQEDVQQRAADLLHLLTSSPAEPASHQTATAAAPAPAPPPRPARPPAPRVCAAPGCGATHGLKRCGGCGTVRYCSQACCKAHWRAHKAECRRLQAERAAAAAAAAAAGVGAQG